MASQIFDLQKPYQWQDLNELTRQTYGFSYPVRVFQSLPQALVEISLSMHLLYSHKMSFAHSFGLGTHGEAASLFLARQGLKAVEFASDSVPEFDEKKALFAIADLDDAITGEKYFTNNQARVNEKMFRVWVSHHGHFHQGLPEEIQSTDVVLFNIKPDFVFAALGMRTQNLNPLVAPTLNWNIEAPKPIEKKTENKAWVEQVEKEGWASGTPLDISKERFYDRAFLYWQDIEGSALRDLLIKEGIAARDIDSSGFGRWNEPRLLKQFEKRGWSPEVFRGTLAFSANLAEDANFKSKLESAYKKLKNLSSF